MKRVADRFAQYGLALPEVYIDEWNYVRAWFGADHEYSMDQQKKLKGASLVAGTMCAGQASGIEGLMYYNAGPGGWNGMFSTAPVRPLKTYYTFKMFRDLRRLGTQVKTEYEDVSMDVKQCKVKVSLFPRISKAVALSKMEELKKGPMYNMQSVQYEHCEAVVKSYENGYVEREYDEFEQTLFRLGNVAFATFAFELFGEIGLRIEYAVKDLHVVNSVCTNGQMGYFPTQSQIPLGGYEVTMFKNHGVQAYADDADYSAIVSTVENINSLER